MFKFINKYISNLKYFMCAIALLPIAICSICFADSDTNPSKDLLGNIMTPAENQGLLILNGRTNNPKSVGNEVFVGSTEIGIDSNGASISKNGSIIVKITKILLSIVVAISVTMVLYNGLQYIVKMSNGEDGSKSLVSNMIFIVVGILVALFSVTIITLLQSIPTTLEKDLTQIEVPDSIE